MSDGFTIEFDTTAANASLEKLGLALKKVGTTSNKVTATMKAGMEDAFVKGYAAQARELQALQSKKKAFSDVTQQEIASLKLEQAARMKLADGMAMINRAKKENIQLTNRQKTAIAGWLSQSKAGIQVLRQEANMLRVVAREQNQAAAATTRHGTASLAAAKATASFRAALRGMGASIGIYTSSTILAATATYALLRAIREAISTGAEYEQTMARVSAITNVSVDTSAWDQLDAKIRSLGATTVFTVTEVAEGALFLGMAGQSSEQIVQSLGATLQLASIGMMNFGEAADIVTNIMGGFQLEANQLNAVVDVMATAVTNSNMTVQQMGKALSYAAPIAESFGISITEVAAMMEVMHNSGIKASRAGTAFRRSMMMLYNPTAKGAAALEKAGVATSNMAGNAINSVDILEGLRDAMVKGRIAAGDLVDIVGVRASNAFIQLVKGANDSSKGIRDMIASIEEADGSASKMQKTIEDTLKADWAKMKSALSELALLFFEKLNPYLSTYLQNATSLVNLITGVGVSNFRGLFGGINPEELTEYIDNVERLQKATSQTRGRGARGGMVTGIKEEMKGFQEELRGAVVDLEKFLSTASSASDLEELETRLRYWGPILEQMRAGFDAIPQEEMSGAVRGLGRDLTYVETVFERVVQGMWDKSEKLQDIEDLGVDSAKSVTESVIETMAAASAELDKALSVVDLGPIGEYEDAVRRVASAEEELNFWLEVVASGHKLTNAEEFEATKAKKEYVQATEDQASAYKSYLASLERTGKEQKAYNDDLETSAKKLKKLNEVYQRKQIMGSKELTTKQKLAKIESEQLDNLLDIYDAEQKLLESKGRDIEVSKELEALYTLRNKLQTDHIKLTADEQKEYEELIKKYDEAAYAVIVFNKEHEALKDALASGDITLQMYNQHLRELSKATEQAGASDFEKTLIDWKYQTIELDDVATEFLTSFQKGLADFVETGKFSMKGFVDYVKKLLIDLATKKFMVQIFGSASMAGGAGGAGGAASSVAGSAVSSMTGTGSSLSGISSMFSGSSGMLSSSNFGASTMLNSVAEGAGYMNVNPLFGGSNMGFGLAGLGGGLIGTYLVGNGSTGSSIGGSLGGMAGYSLAAGSAFGGTALGAQLGMMAGPIGMVIGAVLGSLLGSLLSGGGGDKTPDLQVISGSFGPEQIRETKSGGTNIQSGDVFSAFGDFGVKTKHDTFESPEDAKEYLAVIQAMADIETMVADAVGEETADAIAEVIGDLMGTSMQKLAEEAGEFEGGLEEFFSKRFTAAFEVIGGEMESVFQSATEMGAKSTLSAALAASAMNAFGEKLSSEVTDSLMFAIDSFEELGATIDEAAAATSVLVSAAGEMENSLTALGDMTNLVSTLMAEDIELAVEAATTFAVSMYSLFDQYAMSAAVQGTSIDYATGRLREGDSAQTVLEATSALATGATRLNLDAAQTSNLFNFDTFLRESGFADEVASAIAIDLTMAFKDVDFSEAMTSLGMEVLGDLAKMPIGQADVTGLMVPLFTAFDEIGMAATDAAAYVNMGISLIQDGLSGGDAGALVSGLVTSIADLGNVGLDVATILEESSWTARESIEALGDDIMSQVASFDGSAGSIQNLTGSISNMRTSVIEYAKGIDASIESIDAKKAALRETIITDTMNEEDKYNYIKGQADKLTASLADMTDADDINKTIDEINRLIGEGWNLLDEGQKDAKQQEFLDYLDDANDLAKDRLEDAKTDAIDAATQISDAVTQAFQEPSTNMMNASTNMQGVATDLSAAVHQIPDSITVIVPANETEPGY